MTSIGSNTSVACACMQGFYLNGMGCAACPITYFKDSTGNVSSCYEVDPSEECCQCDVHRTTLATASDAAENCLCIAGVEAATDTDECTSCPAGQYKAMIGSAACEIAQQEGRQRTCRARTPVRV